MRKRALAAEIRILFPVCVWGAISGSTGQELWSGLPKRKIIQREVKDARETHSRVSRKDRIQLLPNVVSVEDFHASNFTRDNVEYNHPLIGCQGYIPMTGTEAALWFRSGVKRGADVVSAAATVENHQSRHLCSKFGFALLGKKLL
jgi:hypothetical protein